MNKVVTYLQFDIFIDCPKCGKQIDLCDGDDGSITTPVFNNDWDKLKGYEVYCECGCEFEIERLEH